MSVHARIKSPAFLCTLFLLIFAALMFRVVWPVDQVLQSNDYNYGLMGQYKTELPQSFFQGFWRGSPLLGRAGHAAPTWTNLSLSALPLDLYMDWIYAINLLLASGFMIAFLRLRRINWLPAIAGTLSAFWLGSNLTLLLPGHLEKYAVMVFASAALYCMEQTLEKASYRWGILTGAALGWMLMHQADLALFFGFVLGAYFVLGWFVRMKTPLLKRVKILLPLLAILFLFVAEAYRFSMQHHVNNVEILQSDDEEAKWDFATQWSFPPQESLDFIAPGYWGWMSSHHKVPYHGVMGQSPEWSEQQQGFPNFKLESVYLGILPVFFACFAICRYRHRRRETYFWTAALLVTFILACGKFSPLYHLFFQLPLVNSIRNPNKFLQVSQWILGILCAFGLQTLLEESFSITPKKRAIAALIVLSLIAGTGSLMIDAQNPSQLEAFAQSIWQGQAGDILRNQQLALLHLSLMAALGAACVWLGLRPRFRKAALMGIVFLIAMDGLLLSREYLKPANTRFIKDNALADFLKENLGAQRVAVVDTNGLYNFYLTQLFPYHHIPFSDIAVAPRLQSDYKAYFEAIGNDRIRLWQEFGVKYVLAPRQISQNILQQPGMDQVMREVYSYDIAEHPRGGLRIAPSKTGQQVVLELLIPSERFSLLSHWVSESSEAYLTSIQKGNPPLKIARVQSEIAPGAYDESVGEVTGVLQQTGGFLIQTEITAERAFLRLSDHYDPQLRVRIDNNPPQALLQTDLLFAGIPLSQGLHEVELFLAPPNRGTHAQWVGLLIALGVILNLVFSSKQSNK